MSVRSFLKTSVGLSSGLLCSLFLTTAASSQPKGFNYDEAKVPRYTLPDPLVCLDGTKVTDRQTWVNKRRPEILRLFEKHVYGRAPHGPFAVKMMRLHRKVIFGGLGVQQQIRLEVRRKEAADSPVLMQTTVLLFLPRKAKRPVPVFLGLNFRGNHTVTADPDIAITSSWVRNDPKNGITNHRSNAKVRGASSRRWAVEKILRHGFGVATAYYGDIVPDHKDGLKEGPHRFFLKPGQNKPAADEWGAIAGWAWGLSRILDGLQQVPGVDGRHVMVMGHSRLGKTALWAGATDQRFALVISNDSGCGGAALSRRAFGETVKRINTAFPHWFCDNFKKYNDHEEKLPVDQHMLIALMAPRPVYVASAQQDLWADPRGEFLSCLHADPVYRLLGTEGLPAKTMPSVNHPVMGRIGYHIRTGKHDVTDFDWEQYLRFAEKHLQPRSK